MDIENKRSMQGLTEENEKLRRANVEARKRESESREKNKILSRIMLISIVILIGFLLISRSVSANDFLLLLFVAPMIASGINWIYEEFICRA